MPYEEIKQHCENNKATHLNQIKKNEIRQTGWPPEALCRIEDEGASRSMDAELLRCEAAHGGRLGIKPDGSKGIFRGPLLGAPSL